MRNTMSDHHKDQLLDALMYRLGMDARVVLMAEVPAAYNAYVGRDVMTVVRTSDLAFAAVSA